MIIKIKLRFFVFNYLYVVLNKIRLGWVGLLNLLKEKPHFPKYNTQQKHLRN